MHSRKRIRPWDKKRKISINPLEKKDACKSDHDSHSPVIPSITVPTKTTDGRRAATTYWSDRFYLNRTIYHDDSDSLNANMGGYPNACTCGASSSPPPLMDLPALVASLDLQAAILSTYGFDEDYIATAYPSLCTIPTFIAHGKKGWTLSEPRGTQDGTTRGEIDEEDQDSVYEEGFEDPGDSQADAGSVAASISSFQTQVQDVSATGRVRNTNSSVSSPTSPASIHFTEIMSTWIHPRDVLYQDKLLKKDGSLVDSMCQIRMHAKGVHHSKLMLLFENSGALTLVVTTANLTRPTTIDGSWVQRFPPLSSCTPSETSRTLADYFLKQTLASQRGQLTSLGFLQRYLGWKGLTGFDRFDFSKIQVKLIPTVPGEHPGKDTASTHLKQHATTSSLQIQESLYGRQRVEAILNSRTSECPQLKSLLLSDDDILCFQPTSFGSEWNTANFIDTIRSYLDCDRRITSSRLTDDSLISRTRIFWPTEDYIKAVLQTLHGRVLPQSIAAIGAGFQPNGHFDHGTTDKENEGYLFLSSETFNRIEISCLTRMSMYQSSYPEQISPLVPHIKCVSRISGQRKTYHIQKLGFARAEEYIPWFLLTSACFSRGAQGEPLSVTQMDDDRVRYGNFEFGVLFHSDIRDANKRLYCFRPLICSCKSSPTDSSSTRSELVHLPIPFHIRGHPYVEDDDECIEFRENPYFHEIPSGTGHVGNMALTPLGRRLSRRRRN